MHIMMSYCVFITEQTSAKSYLFVLYNKITPPPRIKQVNSLHFIHPRIWKFEKVEILQISRVHDLYTNKGMLLATLSYVTCDVNPASVL
jgi:hypothetical protein